MKTVSPKQPVTMRSAVFHEGAPPRSLRGAGCHPRTADGRRALLGTGGRQVLVAGTRHPMDALLEQTDLFTCDIQRYAAAVSSALARGEGDWQQGRIHRLPPTVGDLDLHPVRRGPASARLLVLAPTAASTRVCPCARHLGAERPARSAWWAISTAGIGCATRCASKAPAAFRSCPFPA